MKKAITLFVALILFCSILSSCTKTKDVIDIEVTLNLHYGERTGKYTGTLVDDIPNGKGKFTTKNKDDETWYYEGEFVDGHFSGQGKCVWNGGYSQEGTYLNDMLNGSGKLYINDKLKYDGNWKDNLYNGSGKLYSSDGKNYYEGVFIKNIPEEKEFKSKCTNIPYDKLARNPDSYTMFPIKAVGKVIQVVENDDGSTGYRVADNSDVDSIYLISYERKDGESRVLENDLIEFYGLYDGLESYESVLGESITIPFVYAQYISLNP